MFQELVAVAPDGYDGFAAVGSLAGPKDAGVNTGVLKIGTDGTTTVFTINPPADPRPEYGFHIITTEARDIIGLDAHELVVLGLVAFGDGKSTVSYGWAARVGADGETRWSNAFPGPKGTDQIFQFGKRLANGDIIAGGRQQIGPADPKCLKWSKGLIAWLDPDEGTIRKGPVLTGGGKGRMGLYGGTDVPDGSLLFTGFIAARGGNDPTADCQDDLLLLKVDATGSVAASKGIGDARESDIGYDLERIGTRYLLVGMSFDRDSAGWAAIIPPDPKEQAIFRELSKSIGTGGRDRFLAADLDPITNDFIVVGTWSESEHAPNKAWWYRLTPNDLSVVEGGPIRAYAGSGLNGLAALPNGRVLAVGYMRAAEGPQSGWALVLRYGAAPGVPIAERLRPADTTLPRLDALPKSAASYDAGNIVAKTAFFHDGLAAGQRITLEFGLPRLSGLRIIAHPEKGNIDLILSRADETLADFSNYRDDATEVIEEPQASGKYRLTILAQSPVSALDVSLEAAAPIASLDTVSKAQLSRDGRQALAGILRSLGYFAGSETDLAMSPETIRAFMALQNATGEAVDGLISGSVLMAGLAGVR